MARRPAARKLDPDLEMQRGRPPKADSEVTSELLASGEATIAQLALLFNTDAKTLPRRIKGVVPRGTRRGYKVYNIGEAASRIITPGYEIEDFIRQMSPQELPVLLQKEFWNGQRARLEYERQMGNLWPTEDVKDLCGELLTPVRMTILLLNDDVAREVGVTDAQRDVIRRVTDAAIETLQKSIVEAFKSHEDSETIRSRPGLDDGLDDDPLTVDGPADDNAGGISSAEDDSEEDYDI